MRSQEIIHIDKEVDRNSMMSKNNNTIPNKGSNNDTKKLNKESSSSVSADSSDSDDEKYGGDGGWSRWRKEIQTDPNNTNGDVQVQRKPQDKVQVQRKPQQDKVQVQRKPEDKSIPGLAIHTIPRRKSRWEG